MKKKPKKQPKNKGGRPSKKDTINLDVLRMLCENGLTDEQMAQVFDISVATLNNYKQDPKFLEPIKRGKEKHDDDVVVVSLIRRAIGYEHPEEKIFCHNGVIVRAETVKKYPPDPTSLIFWLKNRQPKKWRDDKHIKLGDPDGKPIEFSKIDQKQDLAALVKEVSQALEAQHDRKK